MKVFKDGKLYVNKNDLLILRKSQYQVPESVFGGRESNLILLGIEKQKIFGAFQHQKFYLLSINNSFGFFLNILKEDIIKDTSSTKLINITT